MQLYGSIRHSRINCRYGCCGLKEAKGAKQTSRGKAARKVAKHRARQQAHKEAASSAWEQVPDIDCKD